MHEIIVTRHNDLIDPYLHIWSWEIPIYLFLGGLVAGMMIISGYFILKNKHEEESCSCHILPIISFLALSIGMLALFLDLEHKFFVWRLYLTFKISSPMSWGSWILLLVYPALIGNMLILTSEKIKVKYSILKKLSENIQRNKKIIKFIGIVNLLLGILLGTYTGILLSALGARPLWNSSMLWMLFLVSGLSSAAALVHLIARDKSERELLAKADCGFLFIELFIIILFITGLLSSTRVHIESAQLLLSGPFASSFWVFVIGMGIIIPLPLQLLAVNHKTKHSVVPPLMVIFGGIILRFIIVYAGQVSHW